MRVRLWRAGTNLTDAFKCSVRLGSHDPARKQTNDVIVYNYSAGGVPSVIPVTLNQIDNVAAASTLSRRNTSK